MLWAQLLVPQELCEYLVGNFDEQIYHEQSVVLGFTFHAYFAPLFLKGIICVLFASVMLQMNDKVIQMILKKAGLVTTSDGEMDPSFHDILLELSSHSMENSAISDLDSSFNGQQVDETTQGHGYRAQFHMVEAA